MTKTIRVSDELHKRAAEIARDLGVTAGDALDRMVTDGSVSRRVGFNDTSEVTPGQISSVTRETTTEAEDALVDGGRRVAGPRIDVMDEVAARLGQGVSALEEIGDRLSLELDELHDLARLSTPVQIPEAPLPADVQVDQITEPELSVLLAENLRVGGPRSRWVADWLARRVGSGSGDNEEEAEDAA